MQFATASRSAEGVVDLDLVRARMRSNPRRVGAAVITVVAALVLGSPAGALAATNPALGGTVSNTTTLSGVTSVATSGTHAYTTAYYAGRLTAVDISNPSAPFISGQSAQANTLYDGSNVNITGGYAYVVSKNRNGPSGSNSNDDGTGNGLTILDVTTNPAQPSVVGSVRDTVNLFGAYGIAVSGNYAYVAAQGCVGGQPCPNPTAGNSFAVVDVSSPSSPHVVATIRNSSLPAPWTGTGALNHATSVAISGNYAYVTAAYSNRLTVIDISNPLSPRIVASLQDSTRLSFDVDVSVANGYAYVADQSSGLGRVAVVDIHTPTSPKIVSTVTNSTWLNGAYRIRLRGNFAHVSAVYAASVAAIDISNPLAPRFAGGYNSSANLNRTTGLEVDSSGRYVAASSPYLSSQTQPLYPPYPFQPGGPTITGTITAVDLDPTPISVTISPASEPANPTTLSSANFAFTTSDAVASLQCALDGASFSSCTSPTSQAYSGLGVGKHSFAVSATDAAGTTATDSYTWVVSQGSGGTGPTTPVLDDFNRANGSAGANWSLLKPTGFAALKIAGNAAADASTSAFAWDYWNAASYGPDTEAYLTVAAYGASDTIRLGARISGAGTTGTSGYYLSVSSAGAWSILRVDNGGSPLTLASGPTQALASGDKLAIQIAGSVITALHYTTANGWAQVMSYDTAGDATRYTAAGSLAVEFKTSTIDDFGGGTLP